MGNNDFGGSNYNTYENNLNNGNISENHKRVRKGKSTTLLVVLSIILAFVAIVTSAVAIVAIRKSAKQEEITVYEKAADDNLEPAPAGKKDTKKMYIDCDTVIELKKSAEIDSESVLFISVGEKVEYIEDAENDFAKVKYDGEEGYVLKSSLSDTRPEIWNYDTAEVEDFVEEVLYAYVTAINTDDVSYLSQYLSRTAMEEAINVHEAVANAVYEEEVIYVDCHSVSRASKTSVTVVRESIIRVYNRNGEVNDVVETYLTTVEQTENGMRVVKFEAMD